MQTVFDIRNLLFRFPYQLCDTIDIFRKCNNFDTFWPQIFSFALEMTPHASKNRQYWIDLAGLEGPWYRYRYLVSNLSISISILLQVPAKHPSDLHLTWCLYPTAACWLCWWWLAVRAVRWSRRHHRRQYRDAWNHGQGRNCLCRRPVGLFSSLPWSLRPRGAGWPHSLRVSALL